MGNPRRRACRQNSEFAKVRQISASLYSRPRSGTLEFAKVCSHPKSETIELDFSATGASLVRLTLGSGDKAEFAKVWTSQGEFAKVSGMQG